MTLDPSWQQKAIEEYGVNSLFSDAFDTYASTGYLKGASDFQERILQAVQKNYEDVKNDVRLSEFDVHRMNAIEEVLEDMLRLITEINAYDPGTTRPVEAGATTAD
jgi:hypothetical protein